MDYDGLLEDLEEQDQFIPVVKNVLNQPSLISISSVNGEYEASNPTGFSDVGYYSFRINLPRPALAVDSLQLLSSNIPQANANIPNTACVFWYYRMSAYSGTIPNPNNLFMVRLLPSYYKQEFISSPATYGINRTFKNYKDLATELAKSCANDLAWNNQLFAFALDSAPTNQPTLQNIPFRPNDISLTYNSGINRFQMTGNPTNPVYVYWATGTTYGLGDIVAYIPTAGASIPFPIVAYQSLVSGNTTHTPPDSPTYWKPLYSTECIAKWDSATIYPAGRYASFNNTLYISNSLNINASPNGTIPAWVSGNPYSFGDLVTYSGTTYTATSNSNGTTPPPSGPFYVSVYQTPTTYVTGFVCFYLGNYYVALQTTRGNNPSVSPTFWRPAGTSGWFWSTASLPSTITNAPVYNYLSTGYNDPNVDVAQGTGCQVWNPYNLYEQYQVVSYNGASYTNDYQTQNEVPFNTGGAMITSGVGNGTLATFQSPNNFSVGQLININSSSNRLSGTYRILSRTATTFTVANSVATSTNVLGGNAYYPFFQIVGAWNNSSVYSRYDIVLYNGQYYSVRYGNSNIAPDDPTIYEAPITLGQIYWIPLGTTLYQINDVVNYSGYYRAFQNITNLSQYPAAVNSSWNRRTWSSASNPPVCNISQISQTWDMLTLSPLFANELIYQFPYGVQPQPFTNSPKRLLNTILGFSWNGQFSPQDFQLINQFNSPNIPRINNQYAPLMNRVRPVPVYLVGDTVFPLTLGATATTTTTYTADGYCNLVYSSVISVYSTVVGASTVDTQRDSNLLAIVSMNCGNLGVSSWANFIDNPLMKVKGDIYALTIELRDEFGEPYYITNNAVSTFIFKMTYKS